MSIGRGYNGDRSVSTANQEILTVIDATWTKPRGEYYEFSFQNTQPCTVKVNGSAPIPLDAIQGIESDVDDAVITSFVIVEAGINYKWFGKY